MTTEYIRPTSLLGDQTFAVPPRLPTAQKAVNVIVLATALTAVSATNASAEVLESPEEARRVTDRWTNSGGTVLDHIRNDRVFADAVLEVRRRSGLTWEQLATLFKVERRSVHLWASGRPMSASNAEHLNRVLGVLRLADRGDPSLTKTWLHSPDSRGLLPLDLIREGRFDEIAMPSPAGMTPRPAPLSVKARKARAPRHPEALVGARHDRVHIEKGKLIAAVPLKVSKPK
jgi:transcriptional regulator with XRE-family HTH domain